MPRKLLMTCNGIEYRTKSAIEEEAQRILDSWFVYEEHSCDFFKTLLKDHYNNEKPPLFRTYRRDPSEENKPKTRHLQGLFSVGWYKISWQKLKKWIDTSAEEYNKLAIETKIEGHLRDITTQNKDEGIVCEECGVPDPLGDWNHISPMSEEKNADEKATVLLGNFTW
jgi:hypothetical protein